MMAQPMPAHPMAYPVPIQQFATQPGMQPAQLQPGPPPHVTGQAAPFQGPPQPGPFMQPPALPQMSAAPPGAFPQASSGQVIVGQPAPGGPGLPPDIMGIGRTRSEFAVEQANAALANEANEPQEFQPADPNPGRMYWVRQLDNEWIQMSRATIDALACRWYVWPTGVFYAIRLED